MCYGYPLVLPFAGVEIAVLWLAFYTVILAGQWREIVRVDAAQVTVEKGRIGPLQVYSFDRAWVRVELRGAPFAGIRIAYVYLLMVVRLSWRSFSPMENASNWRSH